MKWITSYKYMFPLLALLALATACEDENEVWNEPALESSVEDFSQYTGEIIRIGIETTLPNASATPEASTRALKEDNGVLQIDYSKMLGAVSVHIALRNKTTREITYKTITDARIELDNGVYKLVCHSASLQLKKGFFKDGSWEVCALIDNRNKVQSGRYKNIEFNTLDYLNPNGGVSDNELEQMEIPLYSKYQDVTTDSEGRKVLRLDFAPLGTVITATLTDPFYTDVAFTQIKLSNSNVVAGNVILNFGEENSTMGIPDIKPKTLGEGRSTLSFKTPVMTKDKKDVKAYLWCIPLMKKSVKPEFNIFYKISLADGADSTEYASQKTLANGYENSRNYRMRIKLPESDLMITEVGHLNPGGWNYSYVEIFNPTNRTIDLWQYGLIRVLDWNSSSSDPNVAIWQNRYSTHSEGSINNALVQSLHLTTEYDPIWTVSGENANASGAQRNLFRLLYVNNIKDQRYTNNHVLEPGKCILIFSGGTREDMARNHPNQYKYFPTGSQCFNSFYLPNAVFKGYCKYVLAVDNGISKNAYAAIGSWKSSEAGVMQHGGDHSMILVKRERVDGGKYQILDAQMGTINKNIFNMFKNNIAVTLPSGNDWAWYGRFANVMYPLTLKPAKQYQQVPIFLPNGGVRNGEGTFLDWLFFIQPWTDFPHRTSPGTRFPMDEVSNGGKRLFGSTLEHG